MVGTRSFLFLTISLVKSLATAKFVPRRFFAWPNTNSLSLWKVNLAMRGLGFELLEFDFPIRWTRSNEISFETFLLSFSHSINLRRTFSDVWKDSSFSSGILKTFRLFRRLWLSSLADLCFSSFACLVSGFTPSWSCWIALSCASTLLLSSVIEKWANSNWFLTPYSFLQGSFASALNPQFLGCNLTPCPASLWLQRSSPPCWDMNHNTIHNTDSSR